MGLYSGEKNHANVKHRLPQVTHKWVNETPLSRNTIHVSSESFTQRFHIRVDQTSLRRNAVKSVIFVVGLFSKDSFTGRRDFTQEKRRYKCLVCGSDFLKGRRFFTQEKRRKMVNCVVWIILKGRRDFTQEKGRKMVKCVVRIILKGRRDFTQEKGRKMVKLDSSHVKRRKHVWYVVWIIPKGLIYGCMRFHSGRTSYKCKVCGSDKSQRSHLRVGEKSARRKNTVIVSSRSSDNTLKVYFAGRRDFTQEKRRCTCRRDFTQEKRPKSVKCVVSFAGSRNFIQGKRRYKCQACGSDNFQAHVVETSLRRNAVLCVKCVVRIIFRLMFAFTGRRDFTQEKRPKSVKCVVSFAGSRNFIQGKRRYKCQACGSDNSKVSFADTRDLTLVKKPCTSI
ncbi:ZN227-like protein [Mya arenaria]|uniref:ZN227-like protein n=1 Tax=Mya arenaria TaxID=6604 RepID=A0ABY7GA96_MYAAR|nr:ZN227-like protein [Mya arenaria]